MTETMQAPQADRERITLQREYSGSVAEIWDLWTSAPGIESWWGPDGFTVTVSENNLTPGGRLRYTMTTVGTEQIAFMQSVGMPLASDVVNTYVAVRAPSHVEFTTLADFVPGVAPYEVRTTLDLEVRGDSTLLTLRFDAMHNAEWTERARLGHESELDRLERVLAA
jgi:uncharacterized protein YndB with AHSA1/START domain